MPPPSVREIWFPVQIGFAVTLPSPWGTAILYKHRDRWRAPGYERLVVHEY